MADLRAETMVLDDRIANVRIQLDGDRGPWLSVIVTAQPSTRSDPGAHRRRTIDVVLEGSKRRRNERTVRQRIGYVEVDVRDLTGDRLEAAGGYRV